MGAAQHRAAFGGGDGTDVADVAAVEMGRHVLVEVLLVLHDAGDDQRPPRPTGDGDRLGRALVGMDAPEEQQVVTG